MGLGLANRKGRADQRINADFDPAKPDRIVARGMVGLVADIDIAGPGHKGGKRYPSDLMCALAVVSALPLKANYVIHSGGGIQCWWLLHKPWIFDSDAKQAEAKSFLRHWQGVVKATAATEGYDVDSTCDLARVMRLPGTFNHKLQVRRRVTVLAAYPTLRYSSDNFAAFFLEDPPKPEQVLILPSTSAAGVKLSHDVVLRKAFGSRTGSSIGALWRGQDLHYPTRSEADAALAHHLAFYVGDAVQLERLLRGSDRVRSKWDERRGAETWIAQQCAAAVANVQERYAAAPLPDTPGLVRIERWLLALPDGPLMVAALQAAGITSEQALAELCGVQPRTICSWRVRFEEVGAKRPRRGYIPVARTLLTNRSLTYRERVTAFHLAGFANGGVARVGIEALACNRRRNERTVRRHISSLETAGVVEVHRAEFDRKTGRRTACNTYVLIDTVVALRRWTEAHVRVDSSLAPEAARTPLASVLSHEMSAERDAPHIREMSGKSMYLQARSTITGIEEGVNVGVAVCRSPGDTPTSSGSPVAPESEARTAAPPPYDPAVLPPGLTRDDWQQLWGVLEEAWPGGLTDGLRHTLPVPIGRHGITKTLETLGVGDIARRWLQLMDERHATDQGAKVGDRDEGG